MPIFCANKNILPKKAIPSKEAKAYGCEACSYTLKGEEYICSKFIKILGAGEPETRCQDSWWSLVALEQSQILREGRKEIEHIRNILHQASGRLT